MKNPEPAYRKRRWKSVDGSVKTKWIVEWRAIDPGTGERKEKRRGGFLTKTQAQTWVRDHLKPALEAGHMHPDDLMHARQQE
ncbi:Arm DNA-binding domain-containing protein [bacterium]|nr:Arm DNA-binding domain-containing protein [bacterium]